MILKKSIFIRLRDPFYLIWTKGNAPDTSQTNAKLKKLFEEEIQFNDIEKLFETSKHIDFNNT